MSFQEVGMQGTSDIPGMDMSPQWQLHKNLDTFKTIVLDICQWQCLKSLIRGSYRQTISGSNTSLWWRVQSKNQEGCVCHQSEKNMKRS